MLTFSAYVAVLAVPVSGSRAPCCTGPLTRPLLLAALVFPVIVAAAAHVHAKVSCSNVVRLVDAGETVGSGCPVSFNGRSYLLASRHCMGLKPGQRIDVTSFTVCGHTLRQVFTTLSPHSLRETT